MSSVNVLGTSICRNLLMRMLCQASLHSTSALSQRPLRLSVSYLSSQLLSLPRWSPAYREKMAYATAYFIVDAQVSGKCLQTLLRDVVVKDGKPNHNFIGMTRLIFIFTSSVGRCLHQLHHHFLQSLPRHRDHGWTSNPPPKIRD
jgi:hypothetical protein